MDQEDTPDREEIQNWIAALEADPRNWRIRRYLADQFQRNDSLDSAIALVVTAPVAPDTEETALFAAGLAARRIRHRALHMLDSWLVHHASSARAHYLKSLILRKDQKDEQADLHERVALGIDPRLNPEDPWLQLDGKLGEEEAAPDHPDKKADSEDKKDSEDHQELRDAISKDQAENEDHDDEAVSSGIAAPIQVTPERAIDEPEAVLKELEKAVEQAGESIIHELMERQTRVIAALTGTAETTELPTALSARGKGLGMTAMAVAVIAHLVVAVLLWRAVVAVPVDKPPEIYARVTQVETDSQLEVSNLKKPTSQRASPAAQKMDVLTSAMFSDVAMPIVESVDLNRSIGMDSELGMDFGMSFSDPGGGDESMGHIPPSMSGRCSMGQRMARLRESGATTAAESAVRNALRFLRDNQNRDGSFGNEYPASMTGLAILAFLGHCETPDSLEFGDSVVKAALYLIEQAEKADGDFIRSPGLRDRTVCYEHPIVTYALCEMYTMISASGDAERIPDLKRTVQKSVGAVIDGQVNRGKDDGGWGYSYQSGHVDSSVVGWNFQALKAATHTGLKIPGLERALDDATDWFKEAQTEDGGFPYKMGQGPKSTLGGVGALAYEMWTMADSKEADRALSWLERNKIERNAKPQAYDWYYNMQAFFLEGGERWTGWNNFAMDQIIATQREDGSFDMNPGHGPKDKATSSIYTTALCTLMLEVYYRYLPTTQKNLGENS